MANWCSNTVKLTGDPARVLQAVQLFRQMTYDEETNAHPVIPDFMRKGTANMVEFGISGQEIGFRTPWSPAIETVRQVAEHFNVDYIHTYQEPGMLVYGEASSHNGIFNNIFIDRSDMAAITFNDETGDFLFEGRSYDDDWPIIAELLDKKRELRDAGIRRADPLFAAAGSTVNEQQPKLSQMELVAWRLAGRLPRIDIDGTEFTIDWRLQELRESERPWNRIDLIDLETGPEGEDYLFFYDTKKHTMFMPAADITELPENVVLVELPNEMVLDPVAVGRQFGGDPAMFLEEHPIQENLIAGIKPLSETFLPQMVAENLRDKGNDPETPGRRIGR